MGKRLNGVLGIEQEVLKTSKLCKGFNQQVLSIVFSFDGSLGIIIAIVSHVAKSCERFDHDTTKVRFVQFSVCILVS